MAALDVARLFADEGRVRVFAAVALGARDTAEVAERAGLPARDVLVALGKLREGGVLTSGDAGPEVAYDHFRGLARGDAEPRAHDFGSGDPETEATLHSFVRGGRLERLPSSWQRKKIILRFIAQRTFEPGRAYSEAEVRDRLKAWCAGDLVDHATLRRYLVDLRYLNRQDAVYQRADEIEDPSVRA